MDAHTDSLRPVDRRSAVGPQVYVALREAIITLKLKPGKALSDKELATAFGVSRTPVREAFHKLAAEDLIEIYPQARTVVSRISLRRISEAQFIREAIEVAVIHRAVRQAGPTDLAHLAQILAAQERAREQCAPDDFFEQDECLHRAFAEIAGVPTAWKVTHSGNVHVDRLRRLSLELPSQLGELIDQHREIVSAVAAKDAMAAEQALRKHLSGALESAAEIAKDHADFFQQDLGVEAVT